MTRPHLMPESTPDYMAPAWASCMKWAIGNDDVREAFRRDPGNTWQPSNTPLDRMIDDATGAGNAFVEAFIVWANEHVWGDPFAPDEDDAPCP